MSDYTKLQARWSKREGDILYSYPRKVDGAYLHYVLGCKRQRYDYTTKRIEYDPSALEELEARGYDIKTLRFSIKRKSVREEIVLCRACAERRKPLDPANRDIFDRYARLKTCRDCGLVAPCCVYREPDAWDEGDVREELGRDG